MRRLKYELGTRFYEKGDSLRDNISEVYKLDQKNRIYEMIVKDCEGNTIYFFDILENKIDEVLELVI